MWSDPEWVSARQTRETSLRNAHDSVVRSRFILPATQITVRFPGKFDVFMQIFEIFAIR